MSIAGVSAAPALAASAPTVAPGAIVLNATPDTQNGFDVSYPQCSGTAGATGMLPAQAQFAVVGVNKGLANTTNPCFQNQVRWAQGSTGGGAEQPVAAIYVNTGNPALAGSWWPASNVTQSGLPVTSSHGTCKHTASTACSYIYGYSMAYDDAQTRINEVPNGQTALNLDPANFAWWLDVETSNTWQKDVSLNRAALMGWTDYLQTLGVDIGFYSTASQWKAITGTIDASSALGSRDSWIAGASSTGAANVCEGTPLSPGGRIAVVQYISGSFDNDLSCHQFVATQPTISGIAGKGHRFTANKGVWQDTPTSLTYQWLRNGAAISKATASTYTTTSSDIGKSLAVRVTGKRSGFSTAALTSASTYINHAFTTVPKPTISGTAKVGSTLKLTHHTWSPTPTKFTYQWFRSGVAITGATGTTHKLTSADAGHTITVQVTGSRTHYSTTTVSSAASKKVVS